MTMFATLLSRKLKVFAKILYTAIDPDWASVNFGVFLCINCAGIHRGMSISKVRSVRLDSWSPDMIKVGHPLIT